MFLQPIKNDDPQLDFYTMYKREMVEYDTEYIRRLDEDLNTTLIFVSLYYVPCHHIAFIAPSGGSVLRSQLCLCHRCPIQARARLWRSV